MKGGGGGGVLHTSSLVAKQAVGFTHVLVIECYSLVHSGPIYTHFVSIRAISSYHACIDLYNNMLAHSTVTNNNEDVGLHEYSC